MILEASQDVNARLIDFLNRCGTQKRKAGNQGNKKRILYVDCISAFDIETSYIPEIEQSFMYIWQYHFSGFGTIVGRTWAQFKELVDSISKACIYPRTRLVTFVHNLSYEFQFLAGIYNFTQEQVFAVDSRKVLKAEIEHIELRCSYLHSNMSLDEYTRKMGVEHAKLHNFDYSKRRYWWTPLSVDEIEYCVNDVEGLCEAIQIEMEHDNDNLYTIPLTSTGYVRRDVKRAMHNANYRIPRVLFPDLDLYVLMREAFRGGNTHANRYYAGRILQGVKSFDRSSSYPDVLCNREYPIRSFNKTDATGLDDIAHLMIVRHKALIMRVAITNVRLLDEGWGAPYLSIDKCRIKKDVVNDNGRILKARYIETSITDVDLRIILSEYDFDDIVFSDVYYSTYGKLPKPIIQSCIDYFIAKTELKNVDGQEIYYMKSKNKLNSIYGMMAQDPGKIHQLFTAGEFKPEFETSDTESLKSMIEDYQRSGFLPYQWGVWTTAWARYALEQGIVAAGEGFVYCDTDSVKYIGDFDIADFNKDAVGASKESGACASDPKGNMHYMGVFEEEKPYDRFLTWGAKKYAYEQDGKLHITIAGVNKKLGAKELEKAGGLEALKPGFIFTDINKLSPTYNDNPPISQIEVDGHVQHITRNVALTPTTYKFGITEEYKKLLGIS